MLALKKPNYKPFPKKYSYLNISRFRSECYASVVLNFPLNSWSSLNIFGLRKQLSWLILVFGPSGTLFSWSLILYGTATDPLSSNRHVPTSSVYDVRTFQQLAKSSEVSARPTTVSTRPITTKLPAAPSTWVLAGMLNFFDRVEKN